MKKERIDEIVKDPNTWEGDGCTYPEDDYHSKDFSDWIDSEYGVKV